MCIENHHNMIREIKNKIENNKLKYKNTIIMGDNFTGKSKVLKELLLDKNNGYYFIDCVNRNFNYKKVCNKENLCSVYTSVLKTRLSEYSFNLNDSFSVYNNDLGFVEEIYFTFEEELKSMLKEFLQIDFDIVIANDLYLGKRKLLKINNKYVEHLSNGYQSIIRLFLELLYFKYSLESHIKESIVVIDNIDEFLSIKSKITILPFLIKKFSNMNFIVTTHSADVIASVIDFNVIALNNNCYELLDGNDFSSVMDVREIFEKIYTRSNDESNTIDITLKNLLYAKINNVWTEYEEKQLVNIDESDLCNSQRIILKEINSYK